MNILLLSVGTRNKIVEYFKEAMYDEFGGKIGNIITADASKLAPAVYLGDKYYIIPKINDEIYLDKILEICKKEKINAVLSLIDPELNILVKNKIKFEEKEIKILCSEEKQCEISYDKIKMYNELILKKYHTAKTYENKKNFYLDLKNKKVNFPVFVKPRNGSASLFVNKVNDEETLENLFKKSNNLIVQEYMDGNEIGSDVYIDFISGEVISIFTKRKIMMRAGETDKSVSFKDKKLFVLIEKFVKDFEYKGQIDIDIFEKNGEYYISEVNPRFGGGYPHAHECGCNHVKMIINNLLGKKNKANIGNYRENIYMMKYNELLVKEMI